MNATVKYNDDGEAQKITVTADMIAKTKFKMDGTTAVAYQTMPVDGDNVVFLSEVTEAMEYVEELPFVQAVALESEGGE